MNIIDKILDKVKNQKNNLNSLKEKKFRLNAKYLKLSYPFQNSAKNAKICSKQILHNALLGKFKDRKARVATLITASEQSDDGYKHYHCYMQFDRKIDVTDQSYFDVCGIHGDYSAIKGSTHQYIDYVKKDGNYLCYDPGINSEPSKPKSINRIMLFVTHQVVTWKYNKKYKKHNLLSIEELFFKAIGDLSPIDNAEACKDLKRCAKHFVNIMRTHYGKVYDENNIIYEKNCFRSHPSIEHWKSNHCKTHALYVYGDSEYGKTEYVKTLFKNAYIIRRIDQLKDFQPGYHQVVILDDVDGLDKLSRAETIALLDRMNNTAMNVKHSHAALPYGIPLIIVSNIAPIDAFSDECYTKERDGAKYLRHEIARRIMYFRIVNDLKKMPSD